MAETEDGEENKGRSKWSCTLCTYNNIAGQLKCDLCSTPRFGSDNGNDAVKRQAKILSQKWSCSVCTYDNIESAHQCTKCDNVRPSESDMNAPEDHAEITECSPNENFPSEVACYLNSEVPSSSELKWKCSRCTYLNFPNAIKCTMCGLQTTKPPKSRSLSIQKGFRLSKELLRNHVTPPVENLHSKKSSFLVTGSLSRYTNFYCGRSSREETFFRAIGALLKADHTALDEVLNYIINDGNIHRSLSYFEYMTVAMFAPESKVTVGDTLLTIAKRMNNQNVLKLLERSSVVRDNLPCAAAGPLSELYGCINHILSFCRLSYNPAIRPYSFNIFKLPFPKTELTTHLLAEMLERKFDPSMSQSLLRYVQVCQGKTPDIRLSSVLNCPPLLLMKNRGGFNSFFDAALQSMFGVCDRMGTLRTQLHDHMTARANWYERSYKFHCLQMAGKLGLQVANDDVEDMWSNCLSAVLDDQKPIEDIHIFAFSHLIQRPVLVLPISTSFDSSKQPDNLLSMATSRSSSYHILEGFYLPFYNNNADIVTRSPIVLIHENGNFYNWITNDDTIPGVQNYVIVNFPRTQFASLFRFVDPGEEKRARSYLSLVQLTPCSVAIKLSGHDCLAEVTNYYFEYFYAAEKTLREQQSIQVVDVVRTMNERTGNGSSVSSISKLFNSSAKRLLSRRIQLYSDNGSDSSNGGESDDSLADDEVDVTVSKMARVNERAFQGN